MQTFINNSVEQQKLSKGEWLHKLPDELIGILPQNVWASLSLDQKKDILRQHNLFEKYNNDLDSSTSADVVSLNQSESIVNPMTSNQGSFEGSSIQSKETLAPEILSVDKGMVSEKEMFDRHVGEMKAKEEQIKSNVNVLAEDKSRIAQEQAINANRQDDVKPSVGYKISSNTASNAVAISQNGSTDDSRTWAAALVRKIFAIFD